MKVNISSEDHIKIVWFESDVGDEKGVDVDLDSSPLLRERLVELTDAHEKAVVVDLENVKYMDSSGIATLVEALQKIKKYGGQLWLTNLSDTVRSVFELSRLDRVFDISPTLDEAKKRLMEAD